MHLMWGTTHCYPISPLLRTNQLVENATILCRKCCYHVAFLLIGKKIKDPTLGSGSYEGLESLVLQVSAASTSKPYHMYYLCLPKDDEFYRLRLVFLLNMFLCHILLMLWHTMLISFDGRPYVLDLSFYYGLLVLIMLPKQKSLVLQI